MQKLLALELEVVQLQQSLQIAQLEFETRSAQLHSLKQRADEAEQRAQVRLGGCRGGTGMPGGLPCLACLVVWQDAPWIMCQACVLMVSV